MYKFLLVLLCLCSCSPKEDSNHLYIYTWFDIIPNEIIQQFQDETGIKVTTDYYDTNQVMEASLMTKKSGYDIVTPSMWPYAERQIKNRMFQKLDKSKLPNFKNIDQVILNYVEPDDPGHIYATPYYWGVAGIAYNKRLIAEIMPDAPLDSWAMLFDPVVLEKFAPYGICLLDDPTEIFMALETYLGLNRDDWSAENTDKALKHLIKIKRYIKKFVSSQGKNDLAKGDAAIIHSYTSDVEGARRMAEQSKTDVEIGFIIPKEGARIWVDCLAIPVDAHNVDNAHKFINFMLRSDIAAKVTNITHFANAVKSSEPYLDKGIKENNLIYPDEKLRDKLYTTRPMPREFEKLLNRRLTQIMTDDKDNGNVKINKDSINSYDAKK